MKKYNFSLSLSHKKIKIMSVFNVGHNSLFPCLFSFGSPWRQHSLIILFSTTTRKKKGKFYSQVLDVLQVS